MIKILSIGVYICVRKICSWLGDRLVHIQVTFHPPNPNTVCSAVRSTKQLLLTNVATVRSMSGPEAAEATSSKSVDSPHNKRCGRLLLLLFFHFLTDSFPPQP